MPTEAISQFSTVVGSYFERRGNGSVAASDDYLIEAGGRLLQLRQAGEETMLLSTMVFYNEGRAEDVLAVPIAEFNAYHLFAGGYCLLVDERSGSLYVEQALTITRLDAAGLDRLLQDFAGRATSCTRWYQDELAKRSMEETAPQGVIFA